MDRDDNIVIVLESDLIYDILSLNTKDPTNMGVMRNMLILLEIMLINKNENAID